MAISGMRFTKAEVADDGVISAAHLAADAS
jgi:hypothetical protein